MKNNRHPSNEIRQNLFHTPKGGLRLHSVMKEQYGVARPGKTAADKANGHVPYRKNRRDGAAKKAKPNSK